jgi:hypothetical protein
MHRVLRTIRLFALGTVLTLGFSGSAWACINDSRTAPQEQQYREQYQPEEYQPQEPNAVPLVLAGVGGVSTVASLAAVVLLHKA